MKTKKIMIAYLVYAIIAGLSLAVWQTVLLYRFFDPYNNEYTLNARDSLQTFGYVMLACLILSLTSAFFLRKKKFDSFTASSRHFSVFASSFLGFLFAAAGILSVIYYPSEIFNKNGNGIFRFLLVLAFFSLFPAALYFILSASARYDGTKIKKAFSFFPTLFAVLYLSSSYLSPDFVFSNHNHILRIVSLAALLFFFIQETRVHMYENIEPLRFTVSLAALICILAYEIPLIIVTAFWEVGISYTTIFEVIECGAIIYIIAVACAMISALNPGENTAQKHPD